MASTFQKDYCLTKVHFYLHLLVLDQLALNFDLFISFKQWLIGKLNHVTRPTCASLMIVIGKFPNMITGHQLQKNRRIS